MIGFGPWLPDIASFESGAATIAKNVVPSTRGFKPFPAFSALASAITARVQGAISVRSQTGVIFNFCGDATKLYVMASDGLSWTDASRAVGGAYGTPVDGYWDFSVFGNYVIATNAVDAPQYYEMGVSTNFDALAGSPPIAAYTDIVRDFSVLAKVDNAYNRIQWSGINDAQDWTPSATTMSDYQDFPEGGSIQGMVGGEYGLVFTERSIYRMAFEGPPTIFRFDRISTALGCRAPQSIASFENIAFFLSHDGFYKVLGGSEISPIGTEKIDDWFVANFNANFVYRITSAIDPIRKLYVVGFPSASSSDGTPDTLLKYHWPTGQWTYSSVSHEIVYTAANQSSATIDDLSGYSATIDGLTFPFDSLTYAGSGQLQLAAFNTSHEQGFFSGSNLEASVETGDFQLSPGRKTLLRGFRPMVEGTTATPSGMVRYRDNLSEALQDDVAVAVNSTGFCNVRRNARYHRARIVIPSASVWTFATGIDDPKASAMGAR